MIVQKIVISRPDGFHARPAGEFAKVAAKYKSNILIHYNNKEISAKSILSLMGLVLKQGDTIQLSIQGEDEEAAYQELSAML